MTAYSETVRQLVHIAMVGFAFLLRYLTWPQAALLALAALVFNATVLARLAPRIMRPADAAGRGGGVLSYPLAILALVVVFRERLDIVAAAWAVMAVGDGAATLVGTRVGGPRLPWNTGKTWSGLTAFAVAGSIGAVGLSAWLAPSVTPMPPSHFTWFAPVVAAVVAAFVETIPTTLDDNLSVPFAAGLTLALWATVDPLALEAESVHFAHRFPWAVLASAAMALAAWKVRSLTVAGAAISTVLGAAIFVFGEFQAWLIMLAASAAVVTSSRTGKKENAARRSAESRSPRQGAGGVIANYLVAAIGAWLMAAIDANAAGALILATGLTAGASSTVASEIGKGYGGLARAVAGLVTAISIAGLFALVFPNLRLLAPFIVLGAALGSVTESVLTRRFEATGVANNDVSRFLNTFAAAAVACASVLIAVALRSRIP